MITHDENSETNMIILVADERAVIERARSVSAYNRTTAPVAAVMMYGGPVAARVYFYADRADLDSDMGDSMACTFQSANEIVEVSRTGVCTVIS